MKVLHVASEVAPFSKTGGLADVVSGLPAAQAAMGIQVKVFSPLYRSVCETSAPLVRLKSRPLVRTRFGELEAGLFVHRSQSGMSTYFVDRPEFFDRRGLYGTREGDYFDNADRFLFFMQAALQACRRLRFRPDIVHCHDWQTGLIPALLKRHDRDESFWRKTRTVFTIHNLAYQGVFDRAYMPLSGIPPEFYSLEGVEFYGRMNFLKAGLVFADWITTVSKGYAAEILSPEYGEGLEGVLQANKNRLTGILNGVDYSLWNPASDPDIACVYSPRRLAGKQDCKAELLAIFGLKGTPATPLLGMVTRLVEQKGLEILFDAVPRLVKTDLRLIILGQGDTPYVEAASNLSRLYPERIGVRIAFDPVLAHKILAGADMLLMPSRFEPCGLNQMYGLKYGSIPVVHAVGGLDDTISPFDPATGTGNGFKFAAYSASSLWREIQRALRVYRDQAVWKRLVSRSMQHDFSWRKAAHAYQKLYAKILAAPHYRPPFVSR